MTKKRHLTVLLTFSLLMTLIPLSAVLISRVAATPTSGDLYEPDDIFENATVISNDQTQQHNIYPVGDVDWLELRVDGVIGVTTKVIIETFGSSGDTAMSLYNMDLTMLLAQNDDKTPGNGFSKISIDLAPGIYYARIDGKGLIFDYSVTACYGRMFQTIYGSSYDDYGQSVQQTSDRGYIVAGYATVSTGFTAFYLAKTDSAGTLQWQNTYGSSAYYYGYSVVQTSDGGYIVAGAFTFNNLLMTYLVKTDSNGNMQWEKRIGPSPSFSRSVMQASDGGYIVAGAGYVSGYASNVYLLKTDSAGNTQWQKTYGGAYDDEGYSVDTTSDGGYIVAGYSKSSSGVASTYLVKTDSAGNVQWEKTYGGTGYFYGSSVQQASDGGYIVAGTWTINNLIAPYTLKTDSAGNTQWQKTYLGYGDVGNSVQQASDGGYIIAGTDWISGSVKEACLLRIDSGGNAQWEKTYGGSADDEGYSVDTTSDGGYVVAGYARSFGAGSADVYVVKTDQNGNSPCNRDVILDEGTSLIPQVVYLILSDPPGDGSYSELVKEETTGWDFTLSAETTVSVGFEAQATFLGSGVSASRDFSVSVGGGVSKSVEVTTSQHWSSNTISDDSHYIGPGYGDTYVGDAWLLHWRIVDRTFPNGTRVNVVEYGPTTHTGFMLSAYEIKNGAVPQPYRSQMLALNPADDNYISNEEMQTLSLVKTETISGGIPYDESYSRTETNTRTFTFNAKMLESTAAQLGFSCGPVDASGKVTVTFSFEVGINYQSSTTTQTRTGFHIYDNEGADTFQVTVWYNPVFGTYMFNSSGRSVGLRGTSNPREYWDNRIPSASNVRISPSGATTRDTLTALYDYSDPDGDPQKGYEIRWYKGMWQQLAYYNQTSVPAGVARKGEEWCFFVRAWDGLAYGDWQQAPWLTIANSAPEASSVYITPTNPVTTDYLTAHYQYYDVDGDPESGTEIRWYKNSVLQSAYNNLLSVPPSATTKGDVWYFTVKPRDGTTFGTLQTSPTKTILNSAPTATSVYISPSYPTDADNLFAAYTYYDADLDPESGSQIRWYKNTILQTAYNDVRTVPASATSSGESWYFTIKPKDGTTFGDIRTSGTVTIDGGSGGGGCPYVYTWDGQAFIKDNNILPASESGNGTDVTDYYKLEQQLTPVVNKQHTSTYTLQIREFESEIDYIDQVKLVAVDHSSGTSIAVTPDGELVTYVDPATPLSCVDDEGIDRLGEIGTMNGNVNDGSTFFQGYHGDWLLLNFGRVISTDAKLILRDDQKCCDVCIKVQVPDPFGNWQTVAILHPRDFWSMEAVNLAAYVPRNADFIVRLLWTAPHRLDYVGLDTSSEAQIKVTSASPTLAVHSALGNVRAKLLFDDEQCVQLVNGQEITLAFRLPDKAQNVCRDFLFCTNGYYYLLTP